MDLLNIGIDIDQLLTVRNADDSVVHQFARIRGHASGNAFYHTHWKEEVEI